MTSWPTIGIEYGPAFQGLTAAWRDGETIYTEVALDAEQAREARRFGIHPALLDSALQGGWLASLLSAEELEPRLPFAWSEVSLHGAGASELRVTLQPDGKEGISLSLADSEGSAVAEVSSLTARPLSAAQLGAAKTSPDGLLALEWSEASLEQAAGARAELWRLPIDSSARDQAEAARKAATQALERIQEWLAACEGRLAILTQGAIATTAEESPDPVAACVWGLVRCAQTEHPGRFLLIDSMPARHLNGHWMQPFAPRRSPSSPCAVGRPWCHGHCPSPIKAIGLPRLRVPGS